LFKIEFGHWTKIEKKMIDPVKLKKILATLLKLLVVVEIIGALSEGLGKGEWQRFVVDVIVATVLFSTWGRIVATVRRKKEEYKHKMQTSLHEVRLWDAFIFSLLWSDEIYSDIPVDRKRLIVISYTLIAFGLVTGFIGIGSGLMPLVISGALVLAAVNLLTWVVSLERGEKEKLETEVKLARLVQTSLLPKKSPQVQGYDIAGKSIPALMVGGDYFDFIPLDGNRMALCLGDVAGKGLAAALLMANLQATLRGQILLGPSPKQCLVRSNKLLYEITSPEKFVTLFYGVLDLKNNLLSFSNGGHNIPFIFLDHQEPRRLRTGGVALGVLEDFSFEEETVPLQPGNLLVVYSDGITEAVGANGEQFGEEGLVALVKEYQHESAENLIDGIINGVKSYSAGAPQMDDMTMIVVKRT